MCYRKTFILLFFMISKVNGIAYISQINNYTNYALKVDNSLGYLERKNLALYPEEFKILKTYNIKDGSSIINENQVNPWSIRLKSKTKNILINANIPQLKYKNSSDNLFVNFKNSFYFTLNDMKHGFNENGNRNEGPIFALRCYNGFLEIIYCRGIRFIFLNNEKIINHEKQHAYTIYGITYLTQENLIDNAQYTIEIHQVEPDKYISFYNQINPVAKLQWLPNTFDIRINKI